MGATQLVVRAARASDLDVLLDLAVSVGSGMTTFPADADTIAGKLAGSIRTFAGRAAVGETQYLLAMGADVIVELMPKHPVHCALPPEAARAAIGRPHRSSAPAMAMLLDKGFRYEKHVDVFDAGPQVHADRDAIRTVAESRVRAVRPAPAMGETHVLASTLDLEDFREDFRVVRARTRLVDGALTLDGEVRRGLQRGADAPVRVSPSHRPAQAAAA